MYYWANKITLKQFSAPGSMSRIYTLRPLKLQQIDNFCGISRNRNNLSSLQSIS